jgi:hypothetical protein
MKMIRALGLAAVLAAALMLGGRTASAIDEKSPDAHSTHFEACAKACYDCSRACESCAHHCAHLVAEGKKEHMMTLGTCTDCSGFCIGAGKVVSHRGPMSALACEACAKACDMCGTECEKFPSDQHMKDCAKACRDCAKACREMLKHVEHKQ